MHVMQAKYTSVFRGFPSPGARARFKKWAIFMVTHSVLPIFARSTRLPPQTSVFAARPKQQTNRVQNVASCAGVFEARCLFLPPPPGGVHVGGGVCDEPKERLHRRLQRTETSLISFSLLITETHHTYLSVGFMIWCRHNWPAVTPVRVSCSLPRGGASGQLFTIFKFQNRNRVDVKS